MLTHTFDKSVEAHVQSIMSDIISSNYLNHDGKQTFIIPLTYPDISVGIPDLERIGYGGDVWEIRVDLLSDSPKPLGPSNLPRKEYVRDQVKTLQRASSMPILFTIRTVSQGGSFPTTPRTKHSS